MDKSEACGLLTSKVCRIIPLSPGQLPCGGFTHAIFILITFMQLSNYLTSNHSHSGGLQGPDVIKGPGHCPYLFLP